MAKEKTAQTGKKSKKKWIIIGVIVFVVLAAIIGTSDDDAATNGETVDTTVDIGAVEPNTSAMVDALAKVAKAAVADGITDTQRDEAMNFIVSNYPNFYENNEIMEQAMTYGYMLDYGYTGNEDARVYADLGVDLVQAVKYVYRGAEAADDEATLINLEQVKESLQKLGYTVE